MKIALYGRKSTLLDHLLQKFEFEVVSPEEDPTCPILCYGGDGAMLGAELKYPARVKIPVRDCETAPHCPEHALEKLIGLLHDGKYRCTELPKLAGVCGDFRCSGLNDIFIHSSNSRSALRFQLQIDDELYAQEMVVDAVGVATVHGSTAYYRSITHGSFRTGIGVAFSNCTELVNHLVLQEDSVVKVRILRGPAELVYDNAPEILPLQEGSVVKITLSEEKAKMILLDEFMCPECRKIRHRERSHGYEDVPL